MKDYYPFRIGDEAFVLDASILELDKKWLSFWLEIPTRLISIECLRGGEVMERPCCLIDINDKHYWADKVTGTMYSAESGACMSGFMRAHIDGIWGPHKPATHGPKKPPKKPAKVAEEVAA